MPIFKSRWDLHIVSNFSESVQNANPCSAPLEQSSSLTGWEGQSPACFGPAGMEEPRAASSKTDQRHQTVQASFVHGLTGSPGMVLVKGDVNQGEVVSLLLMLLRS